MKLLNNNDLIKVSFPAIALLIIHIVVYKTGLYEKFWWMDIPMHLLGGILVAITTLMVMQHLTTEKKLVIKSLALRILIVVAVTALFAVSWETMEFLSDTYLNTNLQASLSDTMKDMSMGIIGAGIISIFLSLKYRSK